MSYEFVFHNYNMPQIMDTLALLNSGMNPKCPRRDISRLGQEFWISNQSNSYIRSATPIPLSLVNR